MKKYKYQDWLDGKVILKYNFFTKIGDNVKLVGWEDFSTNDISLIKKEQKKIFDDLANTLLEKYKTEFNKEIETSLDPDNHCKETISQISAIFEGVIPQTEIISTEFWNCVFSFIELTEIQQFYKNNILRGLDLEYNFIYSPNADTKWLNENSQIYSYTLFKFREWIVNGKKQLTPKINGPTIALFCSIVNQCGVLNQDFDESSEKFIKRVSETYNLESNPNKVRQYFKTIMDIKRNDKHLKIIKSEILPSLPMAEQTKIIEFLESRKLYA